MYCVLSKTIILETYFILVLGKNLNIFTQSMKLLNTMKYFSQFFIIIKYYVMYFYKEKSFS